MFLQICFHKRADGDDLELIEVGIIQRGADELASQALAFQSFRHFGMHQADVLIGAAVLKEGDLISLRDFKLAFGLIVSDWSIVHKPSLIDGSSPQILNDSLDRASRFQVPTAATGSCVSTGPEFLTGHDPATQERR